MVERKAKRRRTIDDAVRTSVMIPRSRYDELERIADGKRVSVAWVVREAVEEYLVAQAPLFGGRSTGSGR